jgi:hypothetical protein
LLNRVDELYFNDYECPESEVDSDVENFESDNEVDYVEHFVEPSVDDTREYIAQARFRNDTCGCKEFYGEPCSQIIDMDAAIEFREYCKEVSKDELDMIIKAELFAHRRSGSVTEAKKHKIKKRECPFTSKESGYVGRHFVIFMELKRRNYFQLQNHSIQMDSLLELMLVLGSFQSMPLHFRTRK